MVPIALQGLYAIAVRDIDLQNEVAAQASVIVDGLV